jgi:hypothetical protein
MQNMIVIRVQLHSSQPCVMGLLPGAGIMALIGKWEVGLEDSIIETVEL